MIADPCPREEAVLHAARAGGWSDELAAHVARCDSCREASTAIRWMIELGQAVDSTTGFSAGPPPDLAQGPDPHAVRGVVAHTAPDIDCVRGVGHRIGGDRRTAFRGMPGGHFRRGWRAQASRDGNSRVIASSRAARDRVDARRNPADASPGGLRQRSVGGPRAGHRISASSSSGDRGSVAVSTSAPSSVTRITSSTKTATPMSWL